MSKNYIQSLKQERKLSQIRSKGEKDRQIKGEREKERERQRVKDREIEREGERKRGKDTLHRKHEKVDTKLLQEIMTRKGG